MPSYGLAYSGESVFGLFDKFCGATHGTRTGRGQYWWFLSHCRSACRSSSARTGSWARDVDHLWPDLKVAHPVASLVVNIAPQDVSEENGSIELWPSTHLETSNGSVIDSKAEVARRAIGAPIRGNTRKGSVLIRDMRLWHRGVPNKSDRPRHMIAMIHNIGWLIRRGPLTFGRGCESAFTDSVLDHNVVFSDEPIDYVGLRTS